MHESHHSDSALLYQDLDQSKSVTQLRDDLSALELSQNLAEGSSPAQELADVMPHGTTLQCTNPLFSQQEGTGSQASIQMPTTVRESKDADMAHQVKPAQAVNAEQSAASRANDEGSDPSAAELADSAQTTDPSAAELADSPPNSASSAYTEQQQQQQEQVEALHSQLRAKASELQTAEAATEYVQRLLNAVTAENRDLRKQLDQKRILKRSVSELQHQVKPAQAVNAEQSAASRANDEGSDPSAAELADSAQTTDPSAAELADSPPNSASSAYTEQQQQQQEQVEALHSQLRAKASELQTAEAATEYVQRLLNAVTAENRDLRKQLDQKRILKRSVSELQRSSSSLASAKAQGLLAEHVVKGAALGLQPGRSEISALWASSPHVRRSLLPEYGSSEPYMRPDQTLEGAESLMGPPGLDSTLAESHSDIVSGLSRPHQSDDGHIESLSQIALRRLSQQGAESSSPSVSGGSVNDAYNNTNT